MTLRPLLLQCKFFLVAFLNLSYNVVPNPLRNYYLRLFGIRVGRGSCIHRCCKFFHVGRLTVGCHSVVNFGCYLDARRGITIGNNVGLAHNVKIYTLGHDIDSPDFETKGRPVVIEDGVFVFANAMIMPGVTLHSNCIVLPGSVVTKDVEENAVVGGNPAKVLRFRESPPPDRTTDIGSRSERKEEKMSILFLLKSFEIGGLEVVTACLANSFVAHGHRVSIFAFADAEHSIINRLDSRVKTYTLRRLSVTNENVYAMRAVMIEDRVQVVVNQWGLPFVPLCVARRAARGLGVKFISVYHNTPDMNGRLMAVGLRLRGCRNWLMRGVLNAEREAFRLITSASMRYNYRRSDCFMVLSPSFVDKFSRFTGIKSPAKLVVQTNPVTVDSGGFRLSFGEKRKEIIYVGRIDTVQKRVERVIETWALLEPENPDWCLTVVGDGPQRSDMERLAAERGLRRVSFVGFRPPADYYRRSSLLLLTSEFEGFPLVLAEAMSFGVVPVVYGSYSAVYDIIADGRDGIIVPYSSERFPAQQMADSVARLMRDEPVLRAMATAAMDKSREYDIETVYQQWMDKLGRLLH